ncbi:MAG: glycosyltransferase [Candidatus Omnitrophota bacterium]|nr:hypothetical protein [Candidatus Omnitrophota bacterium]MBU1929240.1 hypothetical protein [Candidatus Omnitrophota bacterium]MBU2034377.1 hypothetical protein [Candidatus Omnitrophota bacterium]MBU2221548.1 hypothetical protein [Candidatus Omnitrophota bacterium]
MAGKRVLLLHISQVSGHRSASIAIEKTLKILSQDVEILNINAFHYTNPLAEKLINRLYMAVIKNTPGIWDYLYDNQKIVKKLESWKKLLHKLNNHRFKQLFDEFKPDVVACTQAFPCGMVADYKKIHNSDIPLVAVLTDYAPHSYWIYDNVNYFITPAQEISQRLIDKGVPAEKVKPYGIPIDPKFNQPVEPDKIRRKLGLDPSIPTILIMGGSHGLGPITTIIKSLDKVKPEIQLIIIAGANKKLYNFLKKKTKKLKKRILLLGFTDNVHELMAISTLLITKPGGMSLSEALVKKLPMVIVKPLPGQEANNTNYLLEKKAAVMADDLIKINLVIDGLLGEPERLKQLSESSASISKPDSSFDIAKLILNL